MQWFRPDVPTFASHTSRTTDVSSYTYLVARSVETCATNPQVEGSIPDGVTKIFH